MLDEVAHALGARSATRLHRIQSLWGGYGEAVRVQLDDGRTVVVKDVRPDRGEGRGHARKLRSYTVEAAFYKDYAGQCSADCRVPAPLALQEGEDRWLFVLEDLDAAGFDRGHGSLDAQLTWLAHFHATFLGRPPTGLWPVGTYWHLDTRPDELRTMAPGPLREAAGALDQALSSARFQTWVHGDAKPANFRFGPTTAAAVDFQYVGGGVGTKDVIYALFGCDERARDAGLDHYFATLRRAVEPAVDGAALEAEWRGLVPIAFADFHRFLAGWAPGRHIGPDERALTAQALRTLK